MSILDEVVLPFLFVPDGQQDSPEAQAFRAEHLDWVSFPAWFVPHGESEAESGALWRVDADRAGTALAHGPPPDGAYRIAQEGEPPGEERDPDGEPRSSSEQLRIAEYDTAYAKLKAIDPHNPALGPFFERQGHVPTEAEVAALRTALIRARGPFAPVPARPVGPVPPTPKPPSLDTQLRDAIAGTRPANIVMRPENAGARDRRWQVYESQTPGSMRDPKTGIGFVPALRYVNSKAGGADYVKFDGYRLAPDGTIEMIDRKMRVGSDDGKFVFPNLPAQLERQSRALAQNPGHVGVIEVPTEELASQVQKLLQRLEIANITVRVVPLR